MDEQPGDPQGEPQPSFSRVVGYAYPWDVIGDPAFLGRLDQLGIAEVTLAASYHGTRACTPLHPQHRLVEAPHAALYRPIVESTWQGRALRPVAATWVDSADPFADAAQQLIARGVGVHAWLILSHSARLGTERPDLAVRNCFGDAYSYALCVAHPEVRDYIATLASEAVRNVPVAGVGLEGCGQLGVAHNGVHEKTEGAFSPAAAGVLSHCCCTACQKVWAAMGLVPSEVLDTLRGALSRAQHDPDAATAPMTHLLGDELAATLLGVRLASQDAARQQVLDAVRETAPGARITLHGQADLWATGPSPAVTRSAAGDVDAILVPAWPSTPASYQSIEAARRLAPATVSVGAYVSVLAPTNLAAVDEHAAAVLAAGADELHLYHLGLANEQQLAAIGRLARLGG